MMRPVKRSCQARKPRLLASQPPTAPGTSVQMRASLRTSIGRSPCNKKRLGDVARHRRPRAMVPLNICLGLSTSKATSSAAVVGTEIALGEQLADHCPLETSSGLKLTVM